MRVSITTFFLLLTYSSIVVAIQLELESNKERTSFYVDGKLVGNGKIINTEISNNRHSITARVNGYEEKSEVIRPPYNTPNILSFFFTSLDRFSSQEERFRTSFVTNSLTSKTVNINQVNITGNHYALLIANQNFKSISIPTLSTPISDISALGETLTNLYGYKVQTLKNPTRKQTLQAISSYKKRLQPQDSFLLFYAGHGSLDTESDEGYWFSSDTDPQDLLSSAIPNSAITATIRGMQARHIFVVADSCYGGSLTRNGVGNMRITSNEAVLAKKMLGHQTRVVLSSGGLEPVLDGGSKDKQHSIFAEAFIQSLKSDLNVILASELFTGIQIRLAATKQTPSYSQLSNTHHEVGGDFVLIKKTFLDSLKESHNTGN